MTILEKRESPEDFFLLVAELLWGYADVEGAGV